MSSSEAGRTVHRSYLYVPGSHPDRMGKALRAGADAVVLDLEDAVPAARKSEARDAVTDLLRGAPLDTPADVHVRINRAGAGYASVDLNAVVWPGMQAIRLPKAEDPEMIRTVATEVERLEVERGVPVGTVRLYPLIESAVGVLAAGQLAAASPRVARLALGAADLLADLGARGDDDLATLYPRAHLALVSRTAGIGPPIDTVWTQLDDPVGLERAARRSLALGFFGKSVIHPRQLDVVHRVFSPSADELAAAARVVDAARRAEAEGRAAIDLDGTFVDPAVVARATSVLDLRSDL